jgi:hypothetical protein
MFAGATAGAGAMSNSGVQAMAAESGGIMQSAGIIKGSTVQGPGPGALRPVPAMLHHPTFYKHAIPAAKGMHLTPANCSTDSTHLGQDRRRLVS